MKLSKIRKTGSLLLAGCLMFLSVGAAPLPAEDAQSAVLSAEGRDISRLTLDYIPDSLSQTLGLDSVESEKQAVAIDVTDADNLTSITTVNEDGSRSVYSFAQPVKYWNHDANRVEFIDNSLQAVNGLEGLLTGTAYVNEGNEMSVRFPKNIRDGVGVSLDEHQIVMKPYAGDNADPVKKDRDALGAQQDTVEYADALGEGVSLQYSAVNTGVKESIVLNEYNGQNEFQFEIDAKNLVADITDGGIVQFLAPDTGEVVFQLCHAWAVDSYEAEQDDGNEHFSDNFTYQLEPIQGRESDGGRYLVTLVADQEWLSAPGTVYPVVIDPTITHGYQDGNVMYTTVFSATSEKWPSSSYEYTQVGYRSGYGYGLVYVQILDFGVFLGIDPNKISSASINMRQTYGNSKTYVVSAYDSNTSVSRDSATYAVLSSSIGTHLDDVTCASNATYSWDIQDVFRAWLGYELSGNGWSTYQLMIKTPVNSTANSYKQFYCSYSNLYIQVDYQNFLDGIFYIRNANSGKYLDAEWYPYVGANVSQYQFTGNVNQLWEIHYQGNDLYVLYPKVGDRFSLGLSANTSNVDVQTGNSSSIYQHLKLIRNSDGTYRMISNATGKALDVYNASTANGANVIPYPYYGNANQKWYLEKVDDYVIWDSVPQIGQNTNGWCWVASAQMIASHYTTVTATQTDAVWSVKKRLWDENKEYEGGNLKEAQSAFKYFTNNTKDFVDSSDKTILPYSSLIMHLLYGRPVYIGRGYEENGKYYGHATVIYGYVTFQGTTRFLIRDPWPNENETPADPKWFGNIKGSNYAWLYSEICSKFSGGHLWEWNKYGA